jgi:hypothetical protein
MKQNNFYKTVFSIIAMLLLQNTAINVAAQQYQTVTVYTPNHTPVTAGNLVSADYTSSQKNDAKNYWLNKYSNRITYMAEATYKYNCHAYAWHISEGGSQVWINTPGDDAYWNDHSYIEVLNPSEAKKVSFGGPCYYWDNNEYVNLCDHSAVTTSTPDYFISKWGPSPQFRHHINDCPYSTEDLHYYAKPPTLSGPSYFNTSGTFTINNLPSGATVTCYGSLPSSISGNTITLSNTNDTEPGFGTVWAKVTVNNTSYTTNTIWFIHGEYIPEFIIGYTRVGSSEIGGWCISGGDGCFLRVEGMGNTDFQLLGNMQYQARILNSNGSVHYTLPNPFSFTQSYGYFTGCSGDYPYYRLEMRNVTYNPNSAWHRISDLIYGANCDSFYSLGLTASPNPVSGVLSVSFDQETLAQAVAQLQQASSGVSALRPASATLDIRLYDSSGTLQRQASSQGQGVTQLNVSNLPNGVYFLRVYSRLDPSKPEVRRIIIKH